MLGSLHYQKGDYITSLSLLAENCPKIWSHSYTYGHEVYATSWIDCISMLGEFYFDASNTQGDALFSKFQEAMPYFVHSTLSSHSGIKDLQGEKVHLCLSSEESASSVLSAIDCGQLALLVTNNSVKGHVKPYPYLSIEQLYSNLQSIDAGTSHDRAATFYSIFNSIDMSVKRGMLYYMRLNWLVLEGLRLTVQGHMEEYLSLPSFDQNASSSDSQELQAAIDKVSNVIATTMQSIRRSRVSSHFPLSAEEGKVQRLIHKPRPSIGNDSDISSSGIDQGGNAMSIHVHLREHLLQHMEEEMSIYLDIMMELQGGASIDNQGIISSFNTEDVRSASRAYSISSTMAGFSSYIQVRRKVASIAVKVAKDRSVQIEREKQAREQQGKRDSTRDLRWKRTKHDRRTSSRKYTTLPPSPNNPLYAFLFTLLCFLASCWTLGQQSLRTRLLQALHHFSQPNSNNGNVAHSSNGQGKSNRFRRYLSQRKDHNSKNKGKGENVSLLSVLVKRAQEPWTIRSIILHLQQSTGTSFSLSMLYPTRSSGYASKDKRGSNDGTKYTFLHSIVHFFDSFCLGAAHNIVLVLLLLMVRIHYIMSPYVHLPSINTKGIMCIPSQVTNSISAYYSHYYQYLDQAVHKYRKDDVGEYGDKIHVSVHESMIALSGCKSHGNTSIRAGSSSTATDATDVDSDDGDHKEKENAKEAVRSLSIRTDSRDCVHDTRNARDSINAHSNNDDKGSGNDVEENSPLGNYHELEDFYLLPDHCDDSAVDWIAVERKDNNKDKKKVKEATRGHKTRKGKGNYRNYLDGVVIKQKKENDAQPASSVASPSKPLWSSIVASSPDNIDDSTHSHRDTGKKQSNHKNSNGEWDGRRLLAALQQGVDEPTDDGQTITGNSDGATTIVDDAETSKCTGVKKIGANNSYSVSNGIGDVDKDHSISISIGNRCNDDCSTDSEQTTNGNDKAIGDTKHGKSLSISTAIANDRTASNGGNVRPIQSYPSPPPQAMLYATGIPQGNMHPAMHVYRSGEEYYTAGSPGLSPSLATTNSLGQATTLSGGSGSPSSHPHTISTTTPPVPSSNGYTYYTPAYPGGQGGGYMYPVVPNTNFVVSPNGGAIVTSRLISPSGSGARGLLDTLSSLQSQLEYYFSASNLQRDKYLCSMMDTEQAVELKCIEKFNQIQRHRQYPGGEQIVTLMIIAILRSGKLCLSENQGCEQAMEMAEKKDLYEERQVREVMKGLCERPVEALLGMKVRASEYEKRS